MRSKGTTPRGWLARVVITLLMLEAAYLVGANGFLHSDWGRELLNRRPEKLTVAWQRAWTWLPGLVTFRRLELRGNARRASWQVTVERGRMLIWLPSLLLKHFRVLDGSGSGAELAVDLLPPPGEPRAPRRRGRGWRITLGSLTIEPLHVVRIDEHRLSGAGRVRGSARFEVRGPVELDLAEVVYSRGRLDSGEETAAESVQLQGQIHFAPFVVGDDMGGDILAGATGELMLEAQASSLGFLAAYLGSVPWLEVGGRGHLELDLTVTNGWLAPGSRLDLRGPRVTASYFDLEASGEGTVNGIVPEGAGNTEINVLLSEFSVARSTDAATLVQGQGLEMRLTNDSTAIDRPAEGIALEIALPEAEIPDLASFSAYLPEASGLEITGGQGLLAATLEYSAVEQSGRGLFTLSADRVEATFGDVDLRSRIRVDGILPEMLLDQGVLGIASSSVSIEDTEVVRGEVVRGEGWWGRIELAEGTWTRAPADSEAEPGVLEGLIRAELRDTGPLVALLERYVPKLAWFDGLATVHNITAETRTRVQGSALRFEGLQVTGGKKERTEVLGELDLEGKSSSGVLFARWGPLSAAVALEEGDRDWKLTDSREWYERRARAYRGSDPGAAEVVEAPQGISP
jgi:hypothetical protein